MALFEQPTPRSERELLPSADAMSRTLSVTDVETDFVAGVYEKLASVYDVFFGPALHPGRLRAIERMDIQPRDRVLEVGVGTGINVGLYPRHCTVTGIDLSASMLDKARDRVAKKGLTNVRLFEMDATRLEFADDSFDIVYAPYVMSVVPDPVAVAREMRRVCRKGGRIIMLNHFRSQNPLVSRVERLISPMTIHAGFKSDLDLPAFLAQSDLQPISIEKVNIPRMWSLVTCIKGDA
jgi:phosphatidylethanolamine/phosphatidyl-N-methylethanolamine N-methyltransferase